MIVLCGKTATGKNVTREALTKLGYHPIVTCTTREKREGEIDGIDYDFVSEEEFKKMDSEGQFFETTSYKDANNNILFYGTYTKSLMDNNGVLIVNPEGLKKLRKLKTINSTTFLLISDEANIWNRLRQRGSDAEESRRRLNADDFDFLGIDKCIDFAIRTDQGLSTDEVAEIIDKLYRKVND